MRIIKISYKANHLGKGTITLFRIKGLRLRKKVLVKK